MKPEVFLLTLWSYKGVENHLTELKILVTATHYNKTPPNQFTFRLSTPTVVAQELLPQQVELLWFVYNLMHDPCLLYMYV